MTDQRRFATPTFDQTMNDGLGGYACGYCGRADYWVEVGTDTGCGNCNTFVTEHFAALMAELDL